MINFLLKLTVIPVIVIIADLFSENQIYFGSVYEALIIGLVIAVVNLAIEHFMFRRGTFWVTTIIDFVLAVCLLFFGTNMFDDAYLGTLGAVSTALIITLYEYFLHLRLMKMNWNAKIATD